MAFCANCGQVMSDLAVACPNCGHPNELRAQQPARPTMAAGYAGFWTRFAALLIDGLILAIPALVIPLGGFVGFFYYWLMIGLNDGRTLGKMAMGIRIAHPDGSQVSLGTAAGRAAMAIVSGLALGLGYLWAAWDPERRTWHDMVVNTRAFKTR